MQPAGPLAGDVAQRTVTGHPVEQSVRVRFVDIDDGQAQAGGDVPQQPAGFQVVQALLQGRPVAGELILVP